FSFLDLSFCEPVFINWVKPVARETLEQYAKRLRNQIPEGNPVVVGISLGGMLVTEMAKADKDIKGIILASNKTAAEFPGYWRIGKWLPLYKWFPAGLLKKFMLLNQWILGAHQKDQEQLLRQVIRESDMDFVKWAIEAILYWNNKEVPPNLVHIHGNADKLLPVKRVKADYTIDGGTHVMTLDHAGEVSVLLKKLILDRNNAV
ncbi:MAG TPA: alpha/beta hydrolase, partial [Chitinophagaceae bacterium]|nr:alpha/beta hydrolase [Chitinophagaceae bacterium]